VIKFHAQFFTFELTPAGRDVAAGAPLEGSGYRSRGYHEKSRAREGPALTELRRALHAADLDGLEQATRSRDLGPKGVEQYLLDGASIETCDVVEWVYDSTVLAKATRLPWQGEPEPVAKLLGDLAFEAYEHGQAVRASGGPPSRRREATFAEVRCLLRGKREGRAAVGRRFLRNDAGTEGARAPAERTSREDKPMAMIKSDLGRDFTISVCAAGSVWIQRQGQLEKGTLPVFSTDTREQAEKVRRRHCRLAPDGSGLYFLTNPPNSVEDLGAVSDLFRATFAQIQKLGEGDRTRST
jgi:hypothetical protein